MGRAICVTISIDQKLLEIIDSKRGDISRSAFIRRYLKDLDDEEEAS